MSPRHLAGPLEDQCLRGVKDRELSRTAGGFGEPDLGNRPGLAERLPRFVEI